MADHPAKQFHTVATSVELVLAICPPPFRRAKLFFIYPKVSFKFKEKQLFNSFSIPRFVLTTQVLSKSLKILLEFLLFRLFYPPFICYFRTGKRMSFISHTNSLFPIQFLILVLVHLLWSA